MGATPPDPPPPREPTSDAPRAAAANAAGREAVKPVVPAWRRRTRGEVRWPVLVAIGAAIALQVSLPDGLTAQPRFLLPGIEALLLVVLLVLNPRHIVRASGPLRVAGLSLIALVSIGNAVAAAQLVDLLVTGGLGQTGGELLWAGGSVFLTNILVFALWYWELDRGGPAMRASGVRQFPDFLFSQMATPHVSDPHWEPRFADYLYVSFTNAATWGPADTVPLTRWAKLIMMLQSAISLVTVALVVARAVNILG